MAKIDTILFDLGGVLVDYAHENTIQELAVHTDYTPRQLASMMEVVGDDSLEKGEMTGREFFDRLSQEVGFALDYGEFCAIWNQDFGPMPGMEAVVAKLVESFQVCLVSNTNDIHFPYCKKHFPIVSLLHRLFVSYELNARKPEPEVFEKVLKACSAKPEHTVFVDDLPENVECARKLGIKGLYFTGVKKLKADLTSLLASA